MLRRRWLCVSAIAGCLAFPSALALGQANTPSQQPVQEQTQQQEQRAAPAPDADKRLTPEQYAHPCGYTDNADVADLCEQRRMAEAAERQVNWVQAQFWVTVVEILALAVALYFAIVTIRDNRISNRPYISVTARPVPDLGKVGEPLVTDVVITNTGRAPASIQYSVGALGINDPYPSFGSYGKPDFRDYTVHAGNQYMMALGRDLVLSDKERALVMDGTKLIYVRGEIAYRDVFKNEYVTEFRLSYGGKQATGAGNWQVCREGNRAT